MYKHYKFKALKNYINIFGLFLVILSLTSCNSSIKKNANDKKETTDTIKTQIKQSDSTNNSDDIKSDFHQPKVNLTVEGFVNSLKAKERLSPFFSNNWTFTYHEDNRCEGSTDGQLTGLKKERIDSIIKVQVTNDGDGWLCEKTEPRTYFLNFDLMKKIATWDRIEVPNYEHNEKNSFYIVGAGESDYIKLHYNLDNLIIKLEYSSEDPG